MTIFGLFKTILFSVLLLPATGMANLPPLPDAESAILISESPSPAFDAPIEKDMVEIQVPLESSVDESKESLTLRVAQYLQKNMPNKVEFILDKIKIPGPVREEILRDLQHKLNLAPTAISHANAGGLRVQGFAILGVGLSDYLMKGLRLSKYGNWLPERAGFGLILGAGMTVLRVRHEGKSKVIIRLHSDVEKINRVLTYMAGTFVGGYAGKISEFIPEQNKFFERVVMEGTQFGAGGKLILSPNHIEYGQRAGTAIPPVISSSFMYETKLTQYRVNLTFSSGWLEVLSAKVVDSCRRFFRSDDR